MIERRKRKLLITSILLCLIIGMVCVGLGFFSYFQMEKPLKRDRQAVGVEAVTKEHRNQTLLKAMEQVSIEKEIFIKGDELKGEARISNSASNFASVSVTILRDLDGAQLYASDIIDPGFYIENITLEQKLESGQEYPCTVIWNYYNETDDVYLGESATKIILVVEE